MNQLYQNYTSCCLSTGGKHQTTEIGPNSTDNEIREYMFGEHNKRTLKQFGRRPSVGLAIPYDIGTKTSIEILGIDPETLPQMNYNLIIPQGLILLKESGIILPKKLEEIIIAHNGLPTDTMTREELSKYITPQHENPSLRQPAA